MGTSTIIEILKSQANPENVAGMKRFGINSEKTLGISIPILRKLARTVGRDHRIASELWESGLHEARILAAFVDDPLDVTGDQMDRWVVGFDSWDVCDQCCCNLFDRTELGWSKAIEWSMRPEEFVKRAGFALMAGLAWHRKDARDEQFDPFFTCIVNESGDNRNFVKKAVNWALRQIGKRNPTLRSRAIKCAEELLNFQSKSAKWIARDALRELRK